MPPNRTSVPGRKPFKPPRPSTSSAASNSTSKANPKPKATQPRSSLPSASFSLSKSSPEPELDSEPEEPPRPSPNQTQDTDATNDKATIPPALLTRLMHDFAQEGNGAGVRMGKGANRAVGKYMDVFVREAIARAVVERREADEGAGVGGFAGGFLEVEDLEKLAPQLLLDF